MCRKPELAVRGPDLLTLPDLVLRLLCDDVIIGIVLTGTGLQFLQVVFSQRTVISQDLGTLTIVTMFALVSKQVSAYLAFASKRPCCPESEVSIRSMNIPENTSLLDTRESVLWTGRLWKLNVRFERLSDSQLSFPDGGQREYDPLHDRTDPASWLSVKTLPAALEGEYLTLQAIMDAGGELDYQITKATAGTDAGIQRVVIRIITKARYLEAIKTIFDSCDLSLQNPNGDSFGCPYYKFQMLSHADHPMAAFHK